MQLRRKKTEAPSLNITPLIDVVFILLVFFMLATNFAQFRMIGVDAPDDAEVITDDEGAVVVRLQADGTVTVDGDPAPDNDVAAGVALVLANDPNRAFIVRPMPGVTLQEAISAYDATRRAGARKVSFSKPRDEGAGG